VDRAVRETVISRTVQIEKEKAALRKMSLDVVLALIRALELKDKYLAGHSERVSTLAGRTAEELKLSPALVEAIRLSGKLLDIGMIAIPDTILWKPGPLTPEEFDVVKTHVDLGLSILAPLDHLADVRTFVRDHHEHFDGGGYPRGLKGQGISIGGRILLAVDAYDSLLSPRPFRGALTSTEALSLLGRKAGRMIDPDVYLALSRVCGGRRNFTLI
jgi:HD-GYP domain-containing protein (c-di-GMP phosphodiesterase class II)